MKIVKKLDSDLTQLVQSTTTINSIEDIVKELIENSIDANSTNIQINISHYKESLNIECVDNGDGISPNDLELVGDRFCTSKFQSTDLHHLQDIKTFGFRGEALNSILNICSTCIITSKTNEFRSHFQVMFNNDKRLGRPSISSSSSSLSSEVGHSGTSILINDVFGNLPVRKLSLSKISWPQLSINLRSVSFKSLSFKPDCKFKLVYKTEQKSESIKHSGNIQNSVMLQLTKPPSSGQKLNKQGELNLQIINLFNSIYGKNKLKKFESYRASFKNLKINLIICKELSQSKNYQFIFINNRFLNNKELTKDINKLFINVNNDNENEDMEDNNLINQPKLFGKLYKSYPIILVFITGDLNFSELVQDSSKTIYETKNMKYIKPMIIKIINHYINTHLKLQDPGVKPISNKSKDTKQSNKDQQIEDKSHKKYTDAFVLGSKSRVSKINEREIKGRISFEVKSNTSNNSNSGSDIPKWDFKKFKSSLNKNPSCNEEEDTPMNNDILNKIDESDESEDENFEIQCSQGKAETESQFFNSISKFNISINNSNTDIKILNQVDDKFILIKLRISTKDEFQNSQFSNCDMNDTHTVLALLDQHACDERIKLENLIKNYIYDINHMDSSANYKIIRPIEIVLTLEEIQLLENFKDNLSFWGIRFEISKNENSDHNDDGDYEDEDKIVRITHLPDFTQSRFLKNGKEFELRNGIRQYLFDILNQKKRKYSSCHAVDRDGDVGDGGGDEWWLYIPHMPDMILEILKSKSCRSAVMFGDKLSIEECDRLVEQLRQTRIPFRCAHGRPSVAPLIELEQDGGK